MKWMTLFAGNAAAINLHLIVKMWEIITLLNLARRRRRFRWGSYHSWETLLPTRHWKWQQESGGWLFKYSSTISSVVSVVKTKKEGSSPPWWLAACCFKTSGKASKAIAEWTPAVREPHVDKPAPQKKFTEKTFWLISVVDIVDIVEVVVDVEVVVEVKVVDTGTAMVDNTSSASTLEKPHSRPTTSVQTKLIGGRTLE